MRFHFSRFALFILVWAGTLGTAPAARAVDLVGIDYLNGRAFRIPTDGSALSVIGETGLLNVASIERLSDGNLYGFTVTTDTLYRFDDTTLRPTLLGPIISPSGLFEGSLVQAPSGTVYMTNGGDQAHADLLRLDLDTRTATTVGRIRATNADINGMVWRSDNTLVGLDRVANALVTIDPSTGAASTLRVLPFAVGSGGGMTMAGPVGYLVTSGTGSGSNSLYSFDPFTGDTSLIRNLGTEPSALGISALAILVPEPAAAALVPALLLARRRPRRLP